MKIPADLQPIYDFQANDVNIRPLIERIARLEAERDALKERCTTFMRGLEAEEAENANLCAALERRTGPVTDECRECSGTGTVADYVGLEMRCVEAECGTCNGTGRTAARKEK